MKKYSIATARKYLLDCYAIALHAVDASKVMIDYLEKYPLEKQRYRLVAIGKAAVLMAQGVWKKSAERIESGLVIAPQEASMLWSTPPACIEIIVSSHPIPNELSLAAGQRLLNFLAKADATTPLIFLISGGTSSLVEVLSESMTLLDLQRLNHWLITNAIPIHEMNRVRKAVSQIKGGRLAAHLTAHSIIQYLISDVPGDRPADIGSGLLVADSADNFLPATLPGWIRSLVTRSSVLPNESSVNAHVQTQIVASNSLARSAVMQFVQESGITVQCNIEISGDAIVTGADIAQQVIAGDAGIYLYGGETVVTLPALPGIGGRCQSLALSAAHHLDGHHDIVLLAASTDGSDGSSGIAGALVDGATCGRGRLAGHDAIAALSQADAGTYLQETGDLIDTGQTGTNVMDLVIAIKM